MAGGKLHKTKYPGVFFRILQRKVAGQQERTYMVWYEDAQGKARWRSVGTHFGDGIRPQVANAKRDDLIATAREDARGTAPDVFTVGQAIDAYERWARAEGKHIDNEMQGYDRYMRSWVHHVPVGSLTPAMLTDIKVELLAKLSTQTSLHRLSFVRRAINHAIALNLYPGPNPVTSRRNSPFQMPRPQNARIRFLTSEEAQALLAELRRRSRVLHDMALLALRTGLRSTEIFGLTGQDLALDANIIYVTAKGGRRQPVHASADVMDMLSKYVSRPDALLFPARDGGRKRGTSFTFTRAVRALGLEEGISDTRMEVTFHTLRHTFASWLAQSGRVTLLELKELMRHESILMTMRYAHLIPGHQAASLSIVADQLGPIATD